VSWLKEGLGERDPHPTRATKLEVRVRDSASRLAKRWVMPTL
jgi:hypothetical protein